VTFISFFLSERDPNRFQNHSEAAVLKYGSGCCWQSHASVLCYDFLVEFCSFAEVLIDFVHVAVTFVEVTSHAHCAVIEILTGEAIGK